MTAPDTPANLISDLARAVGLSRATLLHYERIGRLRGRRQANGYRVYTEGDRQRLAMLRRLQAAGLSLAECRARLDGQRDTGLLAARLDTLEDEIAAKTRARDLVAGLPGRGSLRDWHDEIERVAPDLHRAWLRRQGFTDAEATQVALLSRDMHGHGACMADFDAVFAGLDPWGPGTPEARRRALALLPARPGAILEIAAAPARPPCSSPPKPARASPRPTPTRARWPGSRPPPRHRVMPGGSPPPRRTWPPCPHPTPPSTRSGPRAAPISSASPARWRCGGPCCGPAARWSCRTWSGAAPPPTRSSAPSGRANTPTWPMSPPACHRHGPRATACGAGSTPAPRRSTPVTRPSPPAWPRWRGRLSGTQVLADLTAGLDCWRNARGQVGYELFVLQRP